MAYALVSLDRGKYAVQEVVLPELQDGECRVAVRVSGVSPGTEKHGLLGTVKFFEAFPTIMGYQSVGVVCESRHPEYAEGDRVFVTNARHAPPIHVYGGGHSSEVVTDRMLRLDPRVPDETAAFGVLWAVGWRGAEAGAVERGERVLVFGLGLVGQMTATLCRLRGADVTGIDTIGSRREIAVGLAADRVFDGKSAELEEQLHSLGPADVVFDTTGRPEVANMGIRCLRKRGRFIPQGWFVPTLPIEFAEAHRREIRCAFPCGYDRDDLAAVFPLAAEGRIETWRMITHRVPGMEAQRAYDVMLGPPEEYLGILIDWAAGGRA